jgi:hypothetical protein
MCKPKLCVLRIIHTPIHRRLRELLERQQLLEQAQAQALAHDMVERGEFTSVATGSRTSEDLKASGFKLCERSDGGTQRAATATATTVRTFNPADFSTTPSTGDPVCNIRKCLRTKPKMLLKMCTSHLPHVDDHTTMETRTHCESVLKHVCV